MNKRKLYKYIICFFCAAAILEHLEDRRSASCMIDAYVVVLFFRLLGLDYLRSFYIFRVLILFMEREILRSQDVSHDQCSSSSSSRWWWWWWRPLFAAQELQMGASVINPVQAELLILKDSSRQSSTNNSLL